MGPLQRVLLRYCICCQQHLLDEEQHALAARLSGSNLPGVFDAAFPDVLACVSDLWLMTGVVGVLVSSGVISSKLPDES